MVGGSPSRACLTCRRRKIKCDLGIPTCGPCQKGHRSCSGPVVRAYRYCGLDESSNDLASAISICRISTLPTSRADRLISETVDALHNDLAPNNRLPALGFHFNDLPRHVGHSQGLDAILECFLFSRRLALIGHAIVTKELELYAQGVTLLRRELLQGPVAATLVGAVMLYQYETIRPDDTRSVQVLSRGVSAILQSWGPDCLSVPLVKTIVLAHLPTAIIYSLVAGEVCFLTQDPWRQILSNAAISQTDLWLSLGKLAPIIERIRSGHFNHRDVLDCLAMHQTILNLTLMLRSSGNEAYTCRNLCYDGQAVLPKTSPWLIWSCLILVNQLFRRMSVATTDREAQTQKAVAEIVALIAAEQSRIPLMITFAGPLAFGVANASDRSLISQAMQNLPTLAHKFTRTDMLTMSDVFTAAPLAKGSYW